MKICPVGAEFHAHGQTDGYDEANSRFSQFWNASNKTHYDHTLNDMQGLPQSQEIIAVLRMNVIRLLKWLLAVLIFLSLLSAVHNFLYFNS